MTASFKKGGERPCISGNHQQKQRFKPQRELVINISGNGLIISKKLSAVPIERLRSSPMPDLILISAEFLSVV